jgi:hypothetical protein
LFDPEDRRIDLETVSGSRPGSSTGDRLIVGLAAIALLGGALVGLSRLLPPPDPEASRESATPVSTVAATPTSTPRATPTVALVDALRTVRISEEPLPGNDVPTFGWSGWARATQRITIHLSPSEADPGIDVVHAGEAIQIQDEAPGLLVSNGNWVRINLPTQGWIRARSGPHANLIRFGDEQFPQYANVQDITPGAHGRYVLTGSHLSDGSTFMAVSDDGSEWEPIGGQGMLDNASYVQVAYGPRDWIAVVMRQSSQGSTPWVWQSADGTTWRALGSLRNLPFTNIGYFQLIGSPLGYVLTFPSYDYPDVVPTRVWYSADGEIWSERDTLAPPGTVVASGVGFYGYQPPNYFPASGPTPEPGVGAFSPDGWEWSSVSTPDMKNLLGVAGGADRLVALNRVGADVQPWIGTVEDRRLAWRQDVASAPAFQDAVVSSLAGGMAPIAMGYERGSEALLWWSNDDAGWHRHQLPRSFGAVPSIGAANVGGVVIVGHRASILGSTPVMWSAQGGTDLRPEARPVVPAVPDLGRAGCARYSRDLLELMTARPQIQVYCYGNAPVTITAWVPRCDGCVGAPADDPWTPAWLMKPEPGRYVHLSPVASDDAGWFDGILAPGVTAHEWEHRWVRVTGHFDDRAARMCRATPSPGQEFGYGGRQQVVDGCRELFVVTSVTVLPDQGSGE